jgi:PAS domain S-box-containing protein
MTEGVRTEQAVAEAFAHAAHPGDAYASALRIIAEQLGWHFAAAWEPSAADPYVLRCVALWSSPGAETDAFERATRSIALGPGEGLPGRVWQSGEALWVADVALHNSLPRRAAAAEAGLHAAACFPLRSERGVVGVAEFLGPVPLAPDNDLLTTLEILGAQLGQLVERRRAEESGHAAEQRHRAALDAALDCFVTMDEQGRVVEFNPAAERTFGYRTEDVLGREMGELIVPPHLREQHREGLRRYLAGGAPRVLDQRIEVEAMRADGSRIPVELAITRIDVPGPAMFTAYLRDITERRLAEAELRASRARVVEAGDAARRQIERDLHDGAQQQLVAVAVSLRIARSRLEKGDPDAALELVDEASSDLSEAISELRELARGIHPAVLTEGGLEPALRGLVRRSAVPAQLVAVPPGRFPEGVEAAIYFTVAEGLTNAARHAQAELVEIEVTHRDGVLRVEVRDDGIGGAGSSAGTGLRGLVDRLEVLSGSLVVSSPSGEGTTILAEVPCAS